MRAVRPLRGTARLVSCWVPCPLPALFCVDRSEAGLRTPQARQEQETAR